MSYSKPSGTTESGRLNQAAAHDTALYDPKVHDNHIVAMYDTDAQARSAREALMGIGVAESAIQVVAKSADKGTMGGVNAEDADSGVWNSIKSLFAPEDDRYAYSHAIGRGHAMLVVAPSATMNREQIIHTLEATNPVDFDARLEEWRQSGYDTNVPHEDYAAATGYGAGSMATEPAADRAKAPTTERAANATYNAGTPGGAAGTQGALPMGNRPAPSPQPPVHTPVAGMADQRTNANRTGAETIEVMEERMRVGKREVASGTVRVRSYIVERPVEEQVTLHEEKVEVERRPVDRAVKPGEMGSFEERTIEARATSEEAVVSKEARVVEEIGLKKTGSDRVETVHDTVRKTEVEIDGDRVNTGSGTTGSGTTGSGTTGSGTTGSGTTPPRR